MYHVIYLFEIVQLKCFNLKQGFRRYIGGRVDTMKDSVPTTSTRADRRLDRASQHVTDFWFPVNEGLLNAIQQKLSGGEYGDAAILVRDIRSDFSLFTFCLRELSKMLRDSEEAISFPNELNPIALLEWAGIERLQQILSTSPAEVSAHTLKGISPERLTRYQETMVSATTCEALSSNYLLDSDLAYSAALMRQLGLTLIAWNYESVYTSAVSALKAGQSLDAAITQRLGFSPSMLALRVVQDWALPTLISEAMADTPSEETALIEDEELRREIEELTSASRTLISICEVGEALARANSSTAYPSAKDDWEFARKEITKTLGPQAIQYLQETLVENCERYFEHVPHIFRGAMVLDPEARVGSIERGEVSANNPYLGKCRPFLRQKLLDLYAERTAGSTRRSNLVSLARTIAPSAGFVRGCVFTIEPSTMLLIPQLAIGTSKIEEYTPVAYWANRKAESIVEQAFHSGGPHLGVVDNEGDGGRISIAAALGSSQRIGVVLLEMNSTIYNSERDQHLLHFKALLQAINDSLALG